MPATKDDIQLRSSFRFLLLENPTPSPGDAATSDAAPSDAAPAGDEQKKLKPVYLLMAVTLAIVLVVVFLRVYRKS